MPKSSSSSSSTPSRPIVSRRSKRISSTSINPKTITKRKKTSPPSLSKKRTKTTKKTSTLANDAILKPIGKRKKHIPRTSKQTSATTKKPSAPTLDDIYKNIMMNDESMVNVSKDVPVTTDKHDKRKLELSEIFFDIISNCDNLSSLCECIPLDKDLPHITTRRFFKVLEGDMNEKKFKILDEAMHHFCMHHRRKTRFPNPNGKFTQYDYDYQPNTLSTSLKTLFGMFKTRGIRYGLRDFEKKGAFLANLYLRWKKVAEVREDFGSLPYQADFDSDLDNKLEFALKSKLLDYKSNYDHFVMLIIQLIGKSSMLRGAQEHKELCWSNIKFSTVPDGEFQGRKTMEIVQILDKTHKLKINSTHKRNDVLTRDVVCICEECPLLCVPCKLLEFKSLCHPKQERVYCFKYGPRKNKFYSPDQVPISNPNQPIGHTTIRKMMTECAEICKYDETKRCTLRGLRSYGITKLVNATGPISETDKMLASRHTSLATHAHYQRSSQSSRDARYKVQTRSSPFPSPTPYPFFQPGFGMHSYSTIPSYPDHLYHPPGYKALPQPSYPVQDSASQIALLEMQNVVLDLNNKVQEMKHELEKKE